MRNVSFTFFFMKSLLGLCHDHILTLILDGLSFNLSSASLAFWSGSFSDWVIFILYLFVEVRSSCMHYVLLFKWLLFVQATGSCQNLQFLRQNRLQLRQAISLVTTQLRANIFLVETRSFVLPRIIFRTLELHSGIRNNWSDVRGIHSFNHLGFAFADTLSIHFNRFFFFGGAPQMFDFWQFRYLLCDWRFFLVFLSRLWGVEFADIFGMSSFDVLLHDEDGLEYSAAIFYRTLIHLNENLILNRA